MTAGNEDTRAAEAIEEIVGSCLARYFADGDAAIDAACREHPHYADEIRGSIRRLTETGLLSSEKIGPYRILSVLGQGGMGHVYLAEQREPLRRRVALKVIKLGMDTQQVLRRFEAERQALALMNHDGIARVFEAGTTPGGQPYFAMEYVPGTPIIQHCDQHRLDTRARLRLFQQVCDAVQHAHHKGVIHRDLKPANILVTVQQGRAVPKVIDFGLARATDHRLLAATLFTEHGRTIGTPEYMSPEQAEMSSADIDTRTDVYSLGVVLYELLVGRLPIPASEFRDFGELSRRIREQAPRRPSTTLGRHDAASASAAQARGTTVQALRRELSSDLDWVVMKAMEMDRNRRYATASELAADVQRYLDHEPVTAGPPGMAYRVQKFAQRYRLQVVAGLLVLAALVVGLVTSLVFFFGEQALAAENARQQQRTQRALDEFNRLADVVKLRDARASEAGLYPAWPENTGRLQRWLDEQGEPLAARLPQLQAALDALRARALPAGVAASEAIRFASTPDQFLHDTLARLVADLRAFAADGSVLAAVRAARDWSTTVFERSITAHAAAWERARSAIRAGDGRTAHAAYAGFDLRPQIGLVPLGMDPDSKLWEFYHLRSGTLAAPPERDPDTGRLPPVTEATGIVFVLLPPGTFAMGAQATDPNGANFDPFALPSEAPVHPVTLVPFFLARHELTIAQWRRLSRGDLPCYYPPGELVGARGPGQRVEWTNPVESVSWQACHDVLARHGLDLPTEAQWEYGTRAGTSTPWWTGAEKETVQGGVNLGDQTAIDSGVPWPEMQTWLRDGFIVAAPVDTLQPNGFGLHHTLGNLWEWCADPPAGYDHPVRPGDGYREGKSTDQRAMRGGSYYDVAEIARCAGRGFERPDHASNSIGVRPARRVLR